MPPSAYQMGVTLPTIPAGVACVAKGRTPMADGNGGLRENAYRSDRNLQALLRRSAPWLSEDDTERLSSFGGWVATAVDEQADYTNRFAPPVLETLDEGGRPRSVVRHNPLYAAVHREVYERGIVGLNYGPERRPYTLTFAMGYLLAAVRHLDSLSGDAHRCRRPRARPLCAGGGA